MKTETRIRVFGYAICLALFSFIIFASWKNSSDALPRTRVLFVGNSLTFVNDLPGMLAGMAQNRSIVIECDMYAPGGYKFSQHASDPVLKGKIDQGPWDFVVLQEQSQIPALENSKVTSWVYPYAVNLCQLIRSASPKAHVAFYETMAWKNGDSSNASVIPEIATYEGMQERLTNSYATMARENQGLLVPVGSAWKRVRSEKPDINLYADEVHPNILGTYLVACVFYAVLFKDTPEGLPHPREIDEDTATYFQQIAHRTAQQTARQR